MFDYFNGVYIDFNILPYWLVQCCFGIGFFIATFIAFILPIKIYFIIWAFIEIKDSQFDEEINNA